MLRTDHRSSSLVALFAVVLAACGGGGGGGGDPDTSAPPPPGSPGPNPPPISGTPPSPPPPPPPPSGPSDAQRTSAATSTAQDNALCNAIRPFYWEIGDKDAKKASAEVGSGAPTASTGMQIASASKWVYAAYVLERQGGVLSASDIKFLTFRSGFNSMAPLSCGASATVDICLNLGSNGVHTPATDGRFFYNGGHMQRHASDINLGGFNAQALTHEVQATIGDFGFVYAQPQPPGGIFTRADGYAAFLRKMLAGNLRIGSRLGSNAVCTNPTTCADADFTPIPHSESWHYSLGHWVEDDPLLGDGAFSSAGLFGFYPWIDGAKTYYGVVARVDVQGDAGYESAQCGRLIRKAWATGVVQ